MDLSHTLEIFRDAGLLPKSVYPVLRWCLTEAKTVEEVRCSIESYRQLTCPYAKGVFKRSIKSVGFEQALQKALKTHERSDAVREAADAAIEKMEACGEARIKISRTVTCVVKSLSNPSQADEPPPQRYFKASIRSSDENAGHYELIFIGADGMLRLIVDSRDTHETIELLIRNKLTRLKQLKFVRCRNVDCWLNEAGNDKRLELAKQLLALLQRGVPLSFAPLLCTAQL